MRTDNGVTVTLGRASNGHFANIYTADGNLVCAVKILKGKANFTIEDSNDFYVVIDKVSYLNVSEFDDVASGSGAYAPISETEKPYNMTVIIIAALFALSLIIVKRISKHRR